MSQTLPPMFKPLLWSHDFARIDAEKHRKTVIIQAINYGTLAHWRWIKQAYGTPTIAAVLASIPATEIRPRARKLASLLFALDTWNYAPRRAH